MARNCFGPFPEKGLDLVAKIAGCRLFWFGSRGLLVSTGSEAGLEVRL